MANVLDVMEDTMSMYNLDIASDQLKRALKEKDKSGRDYISKLDDLTELSCDRVWHELTLNKRVKKTIIPLLKRAYSQITGEGEYETHVKESIAWRINNLKRYLLDLSPLDP